MKQLITIIGAAALIAGSTVTSIKSANLATQNNISIKHIITPISVTVSPAQNIINKINPKTLVFVPNGTDPNISSPKTQTIIKSQLQRYNPKLKASDLSTLSFSGLKQLANKPQPLIVTATVDQTSAHVTIQIRLASQSRSYRQDGNNIVYTYFNTIDIKQILALGPNPNQGKWGSKYSDWIWGFGNPSWALGSAFFQWFQDYGYNAGPFYDASRALNWSTAFVAKAKIALFDGDGMVMIYNSWSSTGFSKMEFVLQ